MSTRESEMASPGRERRRAPRARAEFPLQIDTPSGAMPGKLRDVSENGLCCDFPEPLREMTQVAIDLRLPGRSKADKVVGAVVRCDKLRGVTPPTYEVAVFFTELANETRAALRNHVAENMASR